MLKKSVFMRVFLRLSPASISPHKSRNASPMSQIIDFFKEKYPERLTEIRIPGGNEETGKSNFSRYYGSLAYTDEMFQQDKALMDPYDFEALFMQNGLEREGLVFEEKSLKFDADHPAERGAGPCVLRGGYCVGRRRLLLHADCKAVRPRRF